MYWYLRSYYNIYELPRSINLKLITIDLVQAVYSILQNLIFQPLLRLLMTKINDYNSFVKCALIWIFNEYQMYVERLLTLYTRVQSNTFQGISSFLTFDQTCTDFNKETEFSQVTFVRVPKHHEMFSNLMDVHCTLGSILWHKKPLCKILIMFSKSKL